MAAAVLSLGMAALPLAIAPAANAATSGNLGPCKVTAGKPYFNRLDPLTSKKWIYYPISASCTRGGVQVHMRQIIQEDDPGNSNDVLKNWYTPTQDGKALQFSAPGIKWVTPTLLLTSTGDEGGTAEEVFHRVQFWVTSNGLTQGPITVTSRNFSIWP
ncbi:hypothetical protein QF036_005093 [Arthrobacter globiformis]|nr:hypothetical protein [Arthrobacter globiformis]